MRFIPAVVALAAGLALAPAASAQNPPPAISDWVSGSTRMR
jgi:hypothetical protein